MFRKKKVVWLLLLPGLAGLMLFYVVPFFGGIYSSLMDGSFENQFVGLANYERTLQNSMFQLGLKNTWELSLLCAPVIWLLAFLLAAMLKTLKDRSTAFRNILLLPYLMPSSAMLLIWTLMFDYGGVINRMVTALGMERVLWLEGDALRVPIVLLYIWKNVGFSVVLFASALSVMFNQISTDRADVAFAGSALYILPTLLIYLYFQEDIVAGIQLSELK